MPRRDLRFEPEHYYHIYGRGNNRQPIFFEPDNYEYFLRGVEKYLLENLVIIAYCLMPTHYHLLVRVRSPIQLQAADNLGTSDASEKEVSASCSHGMQRLLISYTKAINKRFDRVGSLFQGQFRAKLIETDPYIQAACVYIHANPVKDGLVSMPEQWPYSDYQEWIGMRPSRWVDRSFVTAQFGTPQAYQALVMDYINARKVSEEFKAYLAALSA
jgi:REP element-mobilizing transposase RayT